ncbi:MAG: anthranilate phosphoribosyltransferase [Nitrospirae bacterium]|nr:anthranilate phosphoribosyltransferase [Nitrospirota bacterium]
MLLVIDNYDSFTYNLVQYLGELGQDTRVFRNDKIGLSEIEGLAPERIVISPGPCTPKEAGISVDLVRYFAGKIPILGVCLGHQAIAEAFGGNVIRNYRLMHGKTSMIRHDGRTIFHGLPNPFEATRYHSLVVRRETLPASLEISAQTEEGEIMGIRHKEYRVEGVQFHPEVQDSNVVDTCGTGGDRSHTFNISTVSAFVVAGAGITVAKHGNRSVSSLCGSADVLKALGVTIDIPPERVERCVNEIGIGFLFAPMHHPAMRHAIGPRQEIGIRTLFNILGPLTNPAGAACQVVGVYASHLTETLSRVLLNLGASHCFVVHGSDGLDEITITGETMVSEGISEGYRGKVKTYKIRPGDFGIKTGTIEDIQGGSAEDNARIVLKILEGERGPRRDIVLLNAAAGIMVGGRASDFPAAIKVAEESIDSGKALAKLEALKRATTQLA